MENIRRIEAYLRERKGNLGLDLEDNFYVDFLAQGEYNKNYRIYSGEDSYVFRLNMGSQLGLDRQVSYEFGALERLLISGVTPCPLYLDDSRTSFDAGLLIMEFLEGRPLIYEKDLEKAAHIFAQIHSIELDGRMEDGFIAEEAIFSARLAEGENLVKNVWDSPLVDREVKGILYDLINYLEDKRSQEKYFIDDRWAVINNTEVNSNNFIIGEKSYLIDWEKPVISDPCQDLTQFLAPTTTLWKTDYVFDREKREEFFRIYIDNLSGGDRNIRERVELYNPYLYLRAFAWCASAYVDYHDPDKKIKNPDTFKTIGEFLDRGFMKRVLGRYIKI